MGVSFARQVPIFIACMMGGERSSLCLTFIKPKHPVAAFADI